MKKLFLLPLMAISLVSCENSTSWTRVEKPNVITVFYGEHCTSYFAEDMNLLYYNYSFKDSSSTIKVKHQSKNEQNVRTDTFVGTNLNIVIWEN